MFEGGAIVFSVSREIEKEGKRESVAGREK
jgi:hypothetical protein